jgi:outer membrane protein assembly factor BamB
VPAGPWRTAQVEVAYPDGLAAMDGAVFVKTDDGHVVRIDPGTAEVVADSLVDTSGDAGHYCQGIGTDGSTLWACSAGKEATDLVRLDPETLEVLETAPVDKLFDQLTLPVTAGTVWALSGSGDELVGTGDGRSRYPLGRRCFQLAATERTVYATCSVSDEVVAVDIRTGDVITADVNNPSNITATDEAVWVSGVGVTRFEPDLSDPRHLSDLSAGPSGDLVAAGDDLWLRNPGGFLYRLDPDTGEVRRHYQPDEPLSGGSILVTDEAVWVSAYDDNLVIRIDPEGR